MYDLASSDIKQTKLKHLTFILAIAVASGSALYIYKNLRPSFQFTLPALDVCDIEKEIWAKARDVCIPDDFSDFAIR
jgi:hypothetical protein